MAPPREELEAKNRRRAALAALPKHPSWGEYIQVHKEEIADIEQRMLHHIKFEAADQRKIDKWLGQISILAWQVRMPINAERDLIKYLRSQGIEGEEEEDTTYVN